MKRFKIGKYKIKTNIDVCKQYKNIGFGLKQHNIFDCFDNDRNFMIYEGLDSTELTIEFTQGFKIYSDYTECVVGKIIKDTDIFVELAKCKLYPDKRVEINFY